MYCPNCGKTVGEGSAFCQHCGKPLPPVPVEESNEPIILEEELPIEDAEKPVESTKRPQRSRSRKAVKYVAVVAVIVVAALIALAVLGSLDSGSSSFSPFTPTYSATVNVSVRNDNWFSSESISIYIDGDLRKTGSVSPLDTESWGFTVSWKSTSQHTCSVVVRDSDGSQSRSVYLGDGDTESVSFVV